MQISLTSLPCTYQVNSDSGAATGILLKYYLKQGIQSLLPTDPIMDSVPWLPPDMCVVCDRVSFINTLYRSFNGFALMYQRNPEQYRYSERYLTESEIENVERYARSTLAIIIQNPTLDHLLPIVKQLAPSALYCKDPQCRKRRIEANRRLAQLATDNPNGPNNQDSEGDRANSPSLVHTNTIDDLGNVDHARSLLQSVANSASQPLYLRDMLDALSDAVSVDALSDRSDTLKVNKTKEVNIKNHPLLAALKQSMIELPKHHPKPYKFMRDGTFDEYNTGMTVEDAGPRPTFLDNFPARNKTYEYTKTVWDVFRDYGYRLPRNFMWPGIAPPPVGVREIILPLPERLSPLASYKRLLSANGVDSDSFKVVSFSRLFDPEAPERT